MLNPCIRSSRFLNKLLLSQVFFFRKFIANAVAGFSLLLSVMLFSHSSQAASPVRVAFVLLGPADSVGWSHSHEQGREYLQQVMKGKVKTTVVDLVASGRSSRAVLQELAEKNDIVFATSYGYMVSTDSVAKNNLQVKFENASGTRLGDNLAAFATRAYQPRYLSGLIAGSMTKTGKIGYVAAHAVPEVIRGINAFTLGVRQANPTAEVKVEWTNSWHKPAAERELAARLVKDGADILAHHSDSSSIAEFAEASGIKVIGFNSDMSAFAPTQHLVSVTHNWGPYYAKRVQALIDNQWQGKSTWMGMEEKTSQLSSLSASIPADVRNLVEQQQAAIIAGTLNVFAGPINNTRGRARIKEGDVLSDQKLLRMNWYVEGVTGSLPSF